MKTYQVWVKDRGNPSRLVGTFNTQGEAEDVASQYDAGGMVKVKIVECVEYQGADALKRIYG